MQKENERQFPRGLHWRPPVKRTSRATLSDGWVRKFPISADGGRRSTSFPRNELGRHGGGGKGAAVRRNIEARFAKAREVKGVLYVGYEAWCSTTGEGSRGEEERGRAAVESSKDRRWQIRGPGQVREWGAPGRWRRIGRSRLFVEGCMAALLHGCTERSADGLLSQGGGRRSSGAGWSSSGGGEVVAQMQD
ncbi:hypothetical protein DHEL01_v211749 [Diaporthe helianthi]|uniref:Uncharacterized protein n=1 Tax=Diaporthe helianthi TaxID=158607 RepID=A0A2P5HHY1_DIAHE|nr:hypothetical protein DHEL01_v211749 [Diaporthe helianthi]